MRKKTNTVGSKERAVVVLVDDPQTLPIETDPLEWWHRDSMQIEGLLLDIAELSLEQDAFLRRTPYQVADYRIFIPEQPKYPDVGFGFYLRFKPSDRTLEAYPFCERDTVPSPLVNRISALFPNSEHWNTFGCRSRTEREEVTIQSWKGISLRDLRAFGALTSREDSTP